MKIGFLGCGAMGSIYAGNLTKAHDVYIFDAVQAVCDAVNTNGITIDEPDGTVNVFHPVKATTDPSELPEVDLMIVFVKYLFLESALQKCKNMIGKNTIVLSLQNGIGNVDEIAKVIPEEQICCGTTAHGALNLGPGHSRHTGIGVTNVGTVKGDRTHAETVAKWLREGGFDVAVYDNVMQLIWHKLFANIAINAVCALLNVQNKYVALNENAHTLSEKMVREAIAVANASGCTFDEEAEVKAAFDVAIATGENRCSMLQDFDRKGITEIKIINGAVVAEGKKVGIDTPYNEAIMYLVMAHTDDYLANK